MGDWGWRSGTGTSRGTGGGAEGARRRCPNICTPRTLCQNGGPKKSSSTCTSWKVGPKKNPIQIAGSKTLSNAKFWVQKRIQKKDQSKYQGQKYCNARFRVHNIVQIIVQSKMRGPNRNPKFKIKIQLLTKKTNLKYRVEVKDQFQIPPYLMHACVPTNPKHFGNIYLNAVAYRTSRKIN